MVSVYIRYLGYISLAESCFSKEFKDAFECTSTLSEQWSVFHAFISGYFFKGILVRPNIGHVRC